MLTGLGALVVRTSDSSLAVNSVQFPAMTLRYVAVFGRLTKLFWDITTNQINSALHPSGVAKLSTSFDCGKGGKVTSLTTAGWQVHCVIPYGM